MTTKGLRNVQQVERAAGMDELFDIVDDCDRIVGQAPRRECHGNPALVHRVAHVLLFNSRGELLLQKRAPHKDVQPGKWDTSVGGHLDPGEGYLQAAQREMGEELGVFDLPLTFLYYSKIRNDFESENVATYLTIYDGSVTFARDEISCVRFWNSVQVESALGEGCFTPNFEEEWSMFKRWQQKYPFLLSSGEGSLTCCGKEGMSSLNENQDR